MVGWEHVPNFENMLNDVKSLEITPQNEKELELVSIYHPPSYLDIAPTART